MENKYYYLVIDRLEKTLQVMECNTCLAVLQEEVQKKYGLDMWAVEGRFRFFFNGTERGVNYNTIYKYAKKYKEIK